MTDILNDKLKTTARYYKAHSRLSPIRDALGLFKNNRHDYTLHAILECFDELGVDVSKDISKAENLENVYSTLNAAYNRVLKNKATVTTKQLKSLRILFYDFANENDISLAELVKEGEQVTAEQNGFAQRLQERRGEKYKNKSVQKWLAKLTHVLNSSHIYLLENFEENPSGYLLSVQTRINEYDSFSLDALKDIRHYICEIYHARKIKEDLSVIDALIRKKAIQSNQENYIELFKLVKNTLQAVKDSPVSTALKHHLSALSWNHNEFDQDVFRIIYALAEIGLHYEILGLVKYFNNENQEVTQELAEAQLQKFLDGVYAIFNSLSVRDDIADEDLKKLKKLIHIFAEKHYFERKIFNIEKVYQQQLDDKNVTEKLQNQPKRKYAYFKGLVNQVDQKKVDQRKKKKILGYINLAVSLVIALGQGLVAAVFFGWALIPSIAIIGTAGAISNFGLFKDDSYKTLKEYFITGIFKDAKGRKISKAKKIIISASLIFALAGAVISGIFAYSSALTAFAAIFAAVSIACPPAGVAILAGVVGIATLVTFTLIFYRILADIVKNNRFVQLKKYFKTQFIDVWLKKPEDWENKTTLSKTLHFAKVTCGVAFRTAVALGTIAFCTLVAVGSMGLAYTHAMSFLQQFPILTEKAVHLITTVGVYAFITPVNTFFYSRAVIKSFYKIQEGLASIADQMTRPKELGKNIKNYFKEAKINKLRTTKLVISVVKFLGMLTCCLFNGAGQMRGRMTDPESVGNTQVVTGLSQEAATKLAGATGGGNSLMLNTLGTQESLSLSQQIDSKQDNTKLARKDEEIKSSLQNSTKEEVVDISAVNQNLSKTQRGLTLFGKFREYENSTTVSLKDEIELNIQSALDM